MATGQAHKPNSREGRSAILFTAVLLVAGCPGGGRSPSGEEGLGRLLESEAARAYRDRAAKAGAEALQPLDRAALGFLWLREGETVRAITELHGVNPRSLDRFERKIFYLLRGAAYYSQGWFDLAGREFLEAEQIRLKVEEVNIEGENTTAILMTDLLTAAGSFLSTQDAGLGTLDLSPVENAAGLIGDQSVVSYVRAEVGRRKGGRDGLEPALEVLSKIAGGDKALYDLAIDELKAGGEPDLEFLAAPGLPVRIGARLLAPLLPGTRARDGGESAFRRAGGLRAKLKSVPAPKPEGG